MQNKNNNKKTEARNTKTNNTNKQTKKEAPVANTNKKPAAPSTYPALVAFLASGVAVYKTDGGDWGVQEARTYARHLRQAAKTATAHLGDAHAATLALANAADSASTETAAQGKGEGKHRAVLARYAARFARLDVPAQSPESKETAEPNAERSKKKRSKKAETPCGCGCGALVVGRFAQGHDGRLKGALLRLADENGGYVPQDKTPAACHSYVADLVARWFVSKNNARCLGLVGSVADLPKDAQERRAEYQAKQKAKAKKAKADKAAA